MDDLISLIAEFQRQTQEKEFLRKMQEQSDTQQEFMLQQRQQGGGGGMPGIGSAMNMIGGGGEGGVFAETGMHAGAEGGGSAGGMGAGMAGVIAAIIGGQHLLSNATDTEVDGVKTDDAFAGHFGTEPWLGYAHDKLGLEPTAGEGFDAAIANKDYGKALEKLPAAADYWADPIRTWLGSGGELMGKQVAGKTGGKVGSAIFNPIGALLKLF